ncbi:MAG: glycosyltransferase [Clostridiaceae bacterium]
MENLQKHKFNIKYSVVIPVYGSGDWIFELTKGISNVLNQYKENYEIILVNDCSPNENTWGKIVEACKLNKTIRAFNLMYNSGQPSATLCGLEQAEGEYIITMDDDFQHMPEELPKLIDAMKTNTNFDCIFGVFPEKMHSWIRRKGSEIYNYILDYIYKRPKNIKSTSLRIMKRDLAKLLVQCKTSHPQIGPMIFSMTKKVGNVPVNHKERAYGESGYTLNKLISETLFTIINISDIPMKIIGFLGRLSVVFSLIAIIYSMITSNTNSDNQENRLIVILISFIGGCILLGICMLGNYIRRILEELTGIPRYLIRHKYENNQSEDRIKEYDD